jgi:hypothetical protein
MKVVIRKEAKQAYIGYMVHSCHSPYSDSFAAMLDKIAGQEIEVETDHLFLDQFNTVPIPGVSEKGLRVTNQNITRVIDDVRPFKMRCQFCGKTSDLGDVCPDCGKTEYLFKFKEHYLFGSDTAENELDGFNKRYGLKGRN